MCNIEFIKHTSKTWSIKLHGVIDPDTKKRKKSKIIHIKSRRLSKVVLVNELIDNQKIDTVLKKLDNIDFDIFLKYCYFLTSQQKSDLLIYYNLTKT